MSDFLLHLHSGFRWVALLLLVIAVVNAIAAKRKGAYSKKDKMINLFAMIVLHTQLLIGLLLSFNSGKVSFKQGWMTAAEGSFRFYGLEHWLMMVIAVLIVTMGRKSAEKVDSPLAKHKKIVFWYTVGLIIILAAIPWPFRSALSAGWF